MLFLRQDRDVFRGIKAGFGYENPPAGQNPGKNDRTYVLFGIDKRIPLWYTNQSRTDVLFQRTNNTIERMMADEHYH